MIVETVLLVRGGIRAFKGGDVDSSGPCKDPVVRKEWRTLERREKDAYLGAVLCLFEKRSVFPDRGSMYDDIVFVHQYSAQGGKRNQTCRMLRRPQLIDLAQRINTRRSYHGIGGSYTSSSALYETSASTSTLYRALGFPCSHLRFCIAMLTFLVFKLLGLVLGLAEPSRFFDMEQ